jgi:hypothetical protein
LKFGNLDNVADAAQRNRQIVRLYATWLPIAMSRRTAPKLRDVKITKGGTTSARTHVFRSFSDRIRGIHIEPIRRRHVVVDDELDTSFSNFKSGLDKWAERT